MAVTETTFDLSLRSAKKIANVAVTEWASNRPIQSEEAKAETANRRRPHEVF
jgi:hypothetical protein